MQFWNIKKKNVYMMNWKKTDLLTTMFLFSLNILQYLMATRTSVFFVFFFNSICCSKWCSDLCHVTDRCKTKKGNEEKKQFYISSAEAISDLPRLPILQFSLLQIEDSGQIRDILRQLRDTDEGRWYERLHKESKIYNDQFLIISPMLQRYIHRIM